ncbi:MAG: hypothetical protein DRJ66_00505 [Thermoprotei archaeon]|nr:MAG: hypothetical protein DRJ66_00505 [Thermoprotei archaeon]RLF20394.1 MAG: hypothetical protein DRZ82_02415 [Thermoprotei archaeon]
MSLKILEVKELTLPEVRKLLEERGKTGELNRMQRITLDYLSKFSKLDADHAVKLKEELIEKHGISMFAAVQIVNILPKTVEELRTILAKEGKVFTEEDLKAILDTISKYASSSAKEEEQQ